MTRVRVLEIAAFSASSAVTKRQRHAKPANRENEQDRKITEERRARARRAARRGGVLEQYGREFASASSRLASRERKIESTERQTHDPQCRERQSKKRSSSNNTPLRSGNLRTNETSRDHSIAMRALHRIGERASKRDRQRWKQKPGPIGVYERDREKAVGTSPSALLTTPFFSTNTKAQTYPFTVPSRHQQIIHLLTTLTQR